MNKDGTLSNNNSSFVKNALFELFHPASEASLIDYSVLSSLVDWDSLKLIDTSFFNLVHVPTIVFFFKYLGALVVTMTIVGAITLKLVLTYLPENTRYYSEVPETVANGHENSYGQNFTDADGLKGLSSEHKLTGLQANVIYPNSKNTDVEEVKRDADLTYNSLDVAVFNSESSGTLNSLNSEDMVRSDVLGASDSREEIQKEIEGAKQSSDEIPPCSFEVDGRYYASGTKVSLKDVTDGMVCANYNPSVKDSTWILSQESSGVNTLAGIARECSVISDLKDGSSLQIKVYNNETKSAGVCSLNFVL